MQENCAPQIVNTQEDGGENSINDEDEKMEKVTRQITNRINELDELWNKQDTAQNVGFQLEPTSTSFFGDGFGSDRVHSEDVEIFIQQQLTFNERVKEEVRDMYKVTEEIKAILLARRGGGGKNRRRSRGQRPLSLLSEPDTIMTDIDDKKRDSRLMATSDSVSLPNVNEGF